jgi:putative transposase
LRYLDESVPPGLDLHLIVDNYATHKHPKVRTWLAQRPHFHMHYTPTYSSWLNQVERWFALITQQAIRRGTFTSVRDLIGKIEAFVQHYNRSSRPFYSGFNSPENQPPLFANFRDITLGWNSQSRLRAVVLKPN